MASFEKYTEGKLYRYTDQLFRVVIINLLTLLTIVLGLFIFGIGIAILASSVLTKLIFTKYDGPIVSLYFKIVKKYFFKSLLISIVYIVLIGLFIFNVQFFYKDLDSGSMFSLIGFIVCLLFLAASIIAFIHAELLTFCFPNSSIFDTVKASFTLTIGFTLRSILLLISFIGLIYLTLLIPILGFIIIFFVLSTLIYFILFKAYSKVPEFKEQDTKEIQILLDSYMSGGL